MSTNEVTITVPGVSFKIAERAEGQLSAAELAPLIAEYAKTFADAIDYAKMAAEAAKVSDARRKPLKAFMMEQGVTEIAGPGGTAKLVPSKSNQPDRDLARRILPPDVYRQIFEERKDTVNLSLKK